MPSRPSLAVRLGLFLVRTLLFFKAALLRFFQALIPFFRRVGKLFFKLLVPGYRVFFFARRNMSAVYRPVKNRLMYIVSNRYSFYVLVVLIAVIGGVTNIQVNAVRAEVDEIGQRSILYALATNERMEFVEEYSDPKDARSYVVSSPSQEGGVLAGSFVQSTHDTLALESSPGLFRADGAFALSDPGAPGEDPSSPTSSLVAASPVRTEITTYAVESGDTLSTIAEKFDINLNTLLWANNLTVRSVLKPGQELTILPVSGVVHTVKSGDTLLAIAKKYNVDSSAIASYNNFDDGGSLQIGQRFIIPGGVITATTPRTTTATVAVKDIFTSAPSGSQGSTTPSAGASMVWPTDLPTLVRGMSWFHTGYDIDCSGRANGTSTNDNYAADGGVVLFAGSKRGYGNTVEIDHGNGLITRYGHFYSLYVESGQIVSAGDPLGRCGSTGNSTGTHLHFEVIDSSTKKFLNPANYIRY
ncbi:M23 family metallopeptidase [bacterium]|nr:M23 family metallopeptidase [bacterium]NBX49249.1 M23 family metallopeptidase [bacterium]